MPVLTEQAVQQQIDSIFKEFFRRLPLRHYVSIDRNHFNIFNTMYQDIKLLL